MVDLFVSVLLHAMAASYLLYAWRHGSIAAEPRAWLEDGGFTAVPFLAKTAPYLARKCTELLQCTICLAFWICLSFEIAYFMALEKYTALEYVFAVVRFLAAAYLAPFLVDLLREKK